jgi:hypothetical protein
LTIMATPPSSNKTLSPDSMCAPNGDVLFRDN